MYVYIIYTYTYTYYYLLSKRPRYERNRIRDHVLPSIQQHLVGGSLSMYSYCYIPVNGCGTLTFYQTLE